MSGVQNHDERCRTMKRRVGGVLEELGNRQKQVKVLREICAVLELPGEALPFMIG